MKTFSFRALAFVFLAGWLVLGGASVAVAQERGFVKGSQGDAGDADVPLAPASRVALVIGNLRKTEATSGANHGAQTLARTLKSLGFETILIDKASREAMLDGVRRFEAALTPGCVAMVVFSGDGVQVQGENWLLAQGVSLERAEDVDKLGLSASKLLEGMASSKAAVKMLILDAGYAVDMPASLSARGLAFMKGPRGSFIAYAQSPGRFAPKGGHYLNALEITLKNLGMPIEDVFKKTAAIVSERTRQEQVPWTSSALQHSIRFSEPEGSKTGSVSTVKQQCQDDARLALTQETLGKTANAARLYEQILKRCTRDDLGARMYDAVRAKAKRYE